MLPVKQPVCPTRKDDRVILHFDYDCFYASVFEAEDPSLKDKPLAVQQKQIIVTCNYVAREQGLRKLQLIKEAKQVCPDVVIVLGEDISRFRDASKMLYRVLRGFSWNDRAERLGLDEVWLDVTDMIDYNISLLNLHDLTHSFFLLDKNDPTKGFNFDASSYSGPTWPVTGTSVRNDTLNLRLKLGSCLASHIRHELERHTGYTSTVGIATSKLLSKLVGNVHKPKNQTTLVPLYGRQDDQEGNVQAFLDDYEIGKIPGIGSKLAQKIRQHILQHEPDFEKGLVYGETKEPVSVKDVRLAPGMSPDLLEKILAGPGSPHGIGNKMWSLLHGVDDTEVNFAKAVPSQISLEDSYIRLDTLPEVSKELKMLSRSLIERMRIDLVSEDDDEFDQPVNPHDRDSGQALQALQALDGHNQDTTNSALADMMSGPACVPEAVKPIRKSTRKWLAHPRTIRLSTRPRLPLNADGTRTRSFKRISHSAPLPNWLFSLSDSVDALAEKLVHETLIGMFRKLHPEKAGWNLSLVNIAVTNMAEAGGESKTAKGRDIGSMFRRQESVHKEFRVYDAEHSDALAEEPSRLGSRKQEELVASGPSADQPTVGVEDSSWVDEEGEDENERCDTCGISVPPFAMSAHTRFHEHGH